MFNFPASLIIGSKITPYDGLIKGKIVLLEDDMPGNNAVII